MSQIQITDLALLELLAKSGEVEFTDSTGRVLGRFLPEFTMVPPPGVTSPFSEEEMAERRKVREGRKLADILRDLEARG